MSFLAWMAWAGVLLLTVSLLSGWIRHLPITTYAIYMLVGLLAGPAVLGLVEIDFDRDAGWLQRLTELSLVVSLFIGGLKLRVPLGHRVWQSAIRLASLAMVLSIAGVMLPLHALLGMDWPLALMLASMLAPTDPVLASQVSVDDASDRDTLRFALSGEAGFNDGSALPFLMLGLLALEHGFSVRVTLHWALLDLAWALPGALAIGYAMGWIAGHVVVRLRTATRAGAPGDLLLLALLLLTYAAAEGAMTLGYVAVFTAGLGLRHTEMAIVRRQEARCGDGGGRGRHGAASRPPAEERIDEPHDEDGRQGPVAAVGRMLLDALTFGDTMERLLGTLMVLLLGVLLAVYASWPGLLVAAWLFVIVRPLAAWLSTAGLHLPWQSRLLLGWLGIRGVGSLNYLAFALTHGLAGHPRAPLVEAVVVTVVAASVAVHGITTSPLLDWRRRRWRGAGRRRPVTTRRDPSRTFRTS